MDLSQIYLWVRTLWLPKNLKTGFIGELLAIQFLRRKGYYIWTRNWRSARGEIDIIVYRNRILSFVEVKTRHENVSRQFSPWLSLADDKQKRMSRAVRQFLKQNRKELIRRRIRSHQLDVVIVYLSGQKSGTIRIEHYPKAFVENMFNEDGNDVAFQNTSESL